MGFGKNGVSQDTLYILNIVNRKPSKVMCVSGNGQGESFNANRAT